MTTYLKDLTQSIGMVDSPNMYLGLGFLDAQVVSLLSVEFLARKDRGQASHVKGSMTI